MTTYKETLGLDAKFNAFEIESRCMNYWENAHTYTFNQNVPRAKIFAMPVSDTFSAAFASGFSLTPKAVRA